MGNFILTSLCILQSRAKSSEPFYNVSTFYSLGLKSWIVTLDLVMYFLRLWCSRMFTLSEVYIVLHEGGVSAGVVVATTVECCWSIFIWYDGAQGLSSRERTLLLYIICHQMKKLTSFHRKEEGYFVQREISSKLPSNGSVGIPWQLFFSKNGYVFFLWRAVEREGV